MLIRSQNKECIINFDNLKSVRIGGYNGDSIIVFTESEALEIGKYSTEEKAIKVLDMIQDAYGHCVAGNIFMNGRIDRVNEMANEAAEYCVREHIDMQVFQMPQDSEV